MAQSSQSEPVGTATREPTPDPPPASWNEALATLITTRAAIFQTESKIVACHAVSSVLKWIISGFFLLFAWMLMIIAIMTVLVSSMDWKWHWVITGAGLFHLLVAAVLLATVKPDKHGYFPITRSEFLKDSEWLKNFQKQKSND